MARRSGLSRSTIGRLWRRFDLKPHVQDTFKISTDPLFIEKIVDVVGLYHNPPEKAVVLCVDEKSQVQALDRSQPVLPMMPGMPERRTPRLRPPRRHQPVRRVQHHRRPGHLRTAPPSPGDRVPQVPDHHRQERPRRAGRPHRLRQLRHPQDRQRSTSGSTAHPRFHIHFTPTGSSWVNQVERFFGLITDKLIRRGVHTSVQALEADIRAMDQDLEREPAPVHLDQDRRRNPQLPRKIYRTNFGRRTLVSRVGS